MEQFSYYTHIILLFGKIKIILFRLFFDLIFKKILSVYLKNSTIIFPPFDSRYAFPEIFCHIFQRKIPSFKSLDIIIRRYLLWHRSSWYYAVPWIFIHDAIVLTIEDFSHTESLTHTFDEAIDATIRRTFRVSPGLDVQISIQSEF